MAEESLTRFVDANIFMRALAWDDISKAERCAELFQRAERGDVSLATSESVVAEVIFVMTSPRLYRRQRAELVALLRPLLLTRGLHMDHKTSVLAALDLYEATNLDFEDCLSVQHVLRQHLDGIYSYDRGFRPALGIARFEP
jgi:predicted nucleic acid-binding protein